MAKILNNVNISCRVCNDENPYFLFEISRGNVYKCDVCSALSVYEKVSSKNESNFYTTIEKEIYVEYFEKFRKKQYQEELTRIKIKPPATLLDVGASYGWLLEVAESIGYNSIGIEPGEASNFKQEISEKIIRLTLESYCERSLEKYEIVTCWHCLEHMYSPFESLQMIKNLAKSGGMVLIAIPTTDGFIFRLALIFKKYFNWGWLLEELFYTHNPNMHFTYMNKKSLLYIMKKMEFQIQSCKTIESFDWRNIWKRCSFFIPRFILRIFWFVPEITKISKFENMVVTAYKK